MTMARDNLKRNSELSILTFLLKGRLSLKVNCYLTIFRANCFGLIFLWEDNYESQTWRFFFLHLLIYKVFNFLIYFLIWPSLSNLAYVSVMTLSVRRSLLPSTTAFYDVRMYKIILQFIAKCVNITMGWVDVFLSIP